MFSDEITITNLGLVSDVNNFQSFFFYFINFNRDIKKRLEIFFSFILPLRNLVPRIPSFFIDYLVLFISKVA